VTIRRAVIGDVKAQRKWIAGRFGVRTLRFGRQQPTDAADATGEASALDLSVLAR
jgi:hypothetical protein